MLPAEIAPTVIVRRDETVAAALAEALLAERVLRESDWDGRSISSSIGAGITRWALEQLGGRDLQRVDLGLFWTDNLQASSHMNPALWRAQRPPVPLPPRGWPGWEGDVLQATGEPVGALALRSEHDGHPDRWPHHRDCIIGPMVAELEAARKGLGYQILTLLGDTLTPLVGVGMPHYTLYEARKQRGLFGHSVVSPERIEAVVPAEALANELKPAALRAALKATLEPRHAEIARLAVDVLGRLEGIRHDARQCDAATLCAANQSTIRFVDPKVVGMAAKLPTFCIRWCRDDGTPEVLQTYLRELKGRGTNLAWCQAWVASDPQSIRRAAANWRAVTSLVLRACRLAEMLHSEVP